MRLEAAEILAQEGEYQQSLDMIQSIRLQQLPQDSLWRLLVLSAETSLALEEGRLTLQYLQRVTDALNSLTRQQGYQLAGYKSQAFELTGHYTAAVNQSFRQTLLAGSNAERTRAEERLWRLLSQVSGEELELLKASTSQPLLKGWVALAEVRQQTSEDFAAFNSLIAAWRSQWAGHPAHQQPPEDIQRLAELSQHQVEHLGIFLPTSGPLADAAKAIRNALVARHFHSLHEGKHHPRLTFFDTQGESLDELYERAQEAGVEVVIGPLAKSRVDLLARRSSLPLPTLALNYSNLETTANQQLFQFGLSAENEAAQVARKAWQTGFRHALALTPEGNWGTRVERGFVEAWRELGGEITHTRQFGDDKSLDSALRELLEVNLSQERHQRLTRLLGQRPHFVARPREDSDFLFLHADTSTARQVKPALSFLMASELPVMATSFIYTGSPNPTQDDDMNGIAFTDITWYLDPGAPLQEEIRSAWPASMNRYGRLYAMGVDAYLLAQRLELLEVLPSTRLEGATGRLNQSEGRIQRELLWAQFINGRPQPLPEGAFVQEPLVDQLIAD
ncbi:penicillin-binding protein activator [Marinospirillum perlucidum]|uniref:penicillin-binding protein activator n=1 Tax=Marinospirillum perlucidum TaxID=1982602 RepID=UPI000DF42713|nr:penicillin-binding protein activator [Marinospirillum perlucidum]